MGLVSRLASGRASMTKLMTGVITALYLCQHKVQRSAKD